MQMRDRRLAFIGPMGSGKSKLVKKFIAKYGGTSLDTDSEFVRLYGPISDFFAAHGEAEFRAREQRIIIDCAQSDATVVATGGGAVTSRRGMNALRFYRDVVYLSAPIDILKARIQKSDRPLKNDLERVMREREPLYERYADYHADSSVDSLVSLENALEFRRPNRYDIALIDSDDTLLDFQSACKWSLGETLAELGVSVDADKAKSIYLPQNNKVWGMLEKGEITRSELFVLREKMFGDALGVTFKQGEFNTVYRNNLKKTRFVLDGAIELLKSLNSKGIKVYIITNADAMCAAERLKPLTPYVSGAFVSETVGHNKPSREFFDCVYNGIGRPNKSRVIVFGDSPTSDIKGGANYGFDTCLYDTAGRVDPEADFSVRNYAEFLKIV